MYYTRRIINILIMCWSLLSASVVVAQNNQQSPLETVLSQSSTTNYQALSLLRELYSIEESIIFPENDQLIVMIEQDYGAQVLLERVDVYVDGKLTISHQIDTTELEILMNRGIFRLAVRLIPPGFHSIDVEIFSFSQAPAKNQFNFNKQSYPQFISLSLTGNQIKLDDWANE